MRPVFIGGAGRSGTTMLGDMLGAHPAHVCPPETSYSSQLVRLGWAGAAGDLEAGLRAVARHPKFHDLGIELPRIDHPTLRAMFDAVIPAYARKIGKPDAQAWIDHTPSNLGIATYLLAQYPDAKIVHLVRDGRAVAASTIPLDWGPNSVVAVAREWVLYVALGLALERAHPERTLLVRYEDVVREPARELKRICAFADLEYRDAMIEGGGLRIPQRQAGQFSLVGKRPDPSRIDAWRTSLPARDIEIFESEVSSLLVLVGYEPMFGGRTRELGPLTAALHELADVARDRTINRVRRQRRLVK